MEKSHYKNNNRYKTAIIISIILAGLVVAMNLKRWNEMDAVLTVIMSAAILSSNIFILVGVVKHYRIRHDLINGLIEGEHNSDKPIVADEKNRELLLEIKRKIQGATLTESLKTKAELHALQNQINPHFLYNTLEIIRSRALVNGNNEVAEMVEALALQFRYCINHQGELATLAQELNNIHNYLLIQRYRYGDRFEFIEEIEDNSTEIMGNVMPVLTLQPLIENALVHGIGPKVDGGNISLRVFASAKRLHIWIEDDGIGIGEETLAQIRAALRNNEKIDQDNENSAIKIGIALPNVNQRIKSYFGDEYGVDVSSVIDIGTTIRVTLPLREYGE